MWNVKAKVIPVIIGVTGTISQSLRQYLSNVTGKQEIQKTAVLGTAHVLRRVQIYRYIFHGRDNITCSTNCKYRTAAILYTLETWFVSGNCKYPA